MDLTAKILNSDATLNSYREIGALKIFPGESKTLALKLFDRQQDIRFFPSDPNASLKVIINSVDGDIEKTATLDPNDKSLAFVDFSTTETQDVIGGNIRLELDLTGNGTQIAKGVVERAIQKITEC